MDNKKEFRRNAIANRESIPEIERTYFNERIYRRFFSLDRIRKASCVLVYISYGSEVDTYTIITELLERNIKVCAPRVLADSTCDMDFYRINSLQDLEQGYKGIPEPTIDCELYVPIGDEIIIVPGTAFDRRLFRMGYGKGFYDNYLEKYSLLYSIGLCYDIQLYDQIPVDEWDHGLNIVITEKEVIEYD